MEELVIENTKTDEASYQNSPTSARAFSAYGTKEYEAGKLVNSVV